MSSLIFSPSWQAYKIPISWHKMSKTQHFMNYWCFWSVKPAFLHFIRPEYLTKIKKNQGTPLGKLGKYVCGNRKLKKLADHRKGVFPRRGGRASLDNERGIWVLSRTSSSSWSFSEFSCLSPISGFAYFCLPYTEWRTKNYRDYNFYLVPSCVSNTF